MVDKSSLHAQVLILCQPVRPIAHLRLLYRKYMKTDGMATSRRKLVLTEQSPPYQVAAINWPEI
jgi:hypothetical protein